MEEGAISADMLGQAINNIGMTDMAKEAATSVTTFEGAMGNLEASAVSGMMKLYDTFAKHKVLDAINGMTGKVEAWFDLSLIHILFISQPMKGKTDEEILEERRKAIKLSLIHIYSQY